MRSLVSFCFLKLIKTTLTCFLKIVLYLFFILKIIYRKQLSNSIKKSFNFFFILKIENYF